jgi:ankyrin repeat protein
VVRSRGARGRTQSAERAEPTSGFAHDQSHDVSRPAQRTAGTNEEVVVTAFPIDLEQARKRAKELLRAARAGDEAAVERIGATPRLADAQRAVARELGRASWADLKHAVEAERATLEERLARFVQAATEARRDEAARLLERDPELAGAGLVPALLLGDGERVAAALRRDPGLPGRRLAPLDWPPLLYLCHSSFLGHGSERTPALVGIARALLDAGADPNATAPSPNWPGSIWTPLYGAAGVAHEPELTRLLLEAGADPDDNESLYHSCESRDHACLRLLLAAGATTAGTNALPHMLDYEDLEGARLLLGTDADPNEGSPGAALRHAVLRGRGPEILELLAAHGAELDAPGDDGLTAYRIAARHARRDELEALTRLGADTTTTPADDFLGACAAGDGERARAILAAHPDVVTGLSPHDLSLVAEASTWEDPEPVRLMLDAGFPTSARGGAYGGTPLHWAAWWGRPATAELLLERGAEVEARSGAELATPLGWAAHGSRDAPPGGDQLAVAKLLVAAGARVDPAFVDAAADDVSAFLAASSAGARTEAP